MRRETTTKREARERQRGAGEQLQLSELLSGNQRLKEIIKTEVLKLLVVRRAISWLHFGVMCAGQSGRK